MALPRFIEMDGRRYLWRDLVALRRAQATPAEPQPTLFTLHEDHRPAGERTAADRYREPSLFTVAERKRKFAGHSLRAGLATSAQAGEYQVQQQLGHASVTMTRRYQRKRERFRLNLTKAAGL
jgi:integrase